jgi:hypothetical protein
MLHKLTHKLTRTHKLTHTQTRVQVHSLRGAAARLAGTLQGCELPGVLRLWGRAGVRG